MMLQSLPIIRLLAIFSLSFAFVVFGQTRSENIDLNRSPPNSPDGPASEEKLNNNHEFELFKHNFRSYHRAEYVGAPDEKNKQNIRRKRHAARKQLNPTSLKRENDRGYERRKKLIAELPEKEFNEYMNKKREKERIRYHARKREGGIGNQFEHKLQIIREKVKQNIATPEEIAIKEKVLKRRRKTAYQTKQRKKVKSSSQATDSAGLDIDLNELPPEDVDPNKLLTNLENEPAVKSPSMNSNRKRSTSKLGKRIRKMRSTNREEEDEETQKQRKRERRNEHARNYYQILKKTRPEKVEEIKERKRQKAKDMSQEERQKKRESDTRTYHSRKAERGFGNSYGMKLKKARIAMKERTATSEQIEIVLRNRKSKLRYYYAHASLSKPSQTQSPSKRQKLTE